MQYIPYYECKSLRVSQPDEIESINVSALSDIFKSKTSYGEQNDDSHWGVYTSQEDW